MIATTGVPFIRHNNTERTVREGASRFEYHHKTVATGGLPRNN